MRSQTIATSQFGRDASRRRIGICPELPTKLKVIIGWDQFNPTAPVQGASWYYSGSNGHFRDLDAVFAAGCKPGDQLIANTIAPNCRDGKNTDSPDHRSHLAYTVRNEPTGAGCASKRTRI